MTPSIVWIWRFPVSKPKRNLIRIRLALKTGFDPNQPRVPAGSPRGGQWTDGTGSGGVRIAQSDPARSRSRIGAGLSETTPAQETLIEITHVQADTAIRRVRQYDPYWEPTPSLFETAEGEIAANRATAREAAQHYEWLQSGGMAPGPFARECIPAPKGASRRFTAAQRREGNRIGRTYGCHTCGTKTPGTSTGNFVLDHLIANGLNRFDEDPWLYPHCAACSDKQGYNIMMYRNYLISIGIIP